MRDEESRKLSNANINKKAIWKKKLTSPDKVHAGYIFNFTSNDSPSGNVSNFSKKFALLQDGRTAFHEAARNGHAGLVSEWLDQLGFDFRELNVKDKVGRCAFAVVNRCNSSFSFCFAFTKGWTHPI